MFGQTQQSYSMLFIDLGRHVSIPLDSSSGTSLKNTDPLHRTIKIHYEIPNVHNKLMFTVHMSLFSYCLIWISVFRL